jgi:hypothetical protein
MSVTNVNATYFTVTPANGYLPAGSFIAKVHSSNIGYATVSPTVLTRAFPATPTVTPASVSFGGGLTYIITGAGFIT